MGTPVLTGWDTPPPPPCHPCPPPLAKTGGHLSFDSDFDSITLFHTQDGNGKSISNSQDMLSLFAPAARHNITHLDFLKYQE